MLRASNWPTQGQHVIHFLPSHRPDLLVCRQTTVQTSRLDRSWSQVARLRLAPGSTLCELCEPPILGLNFHSRPVNNCVTCSLETPPQGAQHEEHKPRDRNRKVFVENWFTPRGPGLADLSLPSLAAEAKYKKKTRLRLATDSKIQREHCEPPEQQLCDLDRWIRPERVPTRGGANTA